MRKFLMAFIIASFAFVAIAPEAFAAPRVPTGVYDGGTVFHQAKAKKKVKKKKAKKKAKAKKGKKKKKGKRARSKAGKCGTYMYYSKKTRKCMDARSK